MLIEDQCFLGVIAYTILQRMSEVVIAKRNANKLLSRGAVEFGVSHYPLMVIMHAAFFVSMIVEFLVIDKLDFHPALLIIFGIAQVIRFWAMSVLGDRWTTRVLVVQGEALVRRGPYRYLSHPNYIVVAIEILVLPIAFGLWTTAAIFSLLNAAMLLLIRIPVEEKALVWSQSEQVDMTLNPN